MKFSLKSSSKLLFALPLLAVVPFIAGWETATTKKLGGSMEVRLACDTKLVNATWKETNLWVLTRPRRLTSEVPETSQFKEHSTFGIMEGKVTFIEAACPR